MFQISSLKLLQQCRNIHAMPLLYSSLSASDQVFFLPGTVTMWWGLLVQHPWIVFLLLPGKFKLCKIHPSECRWRFSNLWTIHTLLFLLLLHISHDPKTSPFRIDSKTHLSACIAFALLKQHPLCYWLAYSRQISNNLGISGSFGDSIRETLLPWYNRIVVVTISK